MVTQGQKRQRPKRRPSRRAREIAALEAARARSRRNRLITSSFLAVVLVLGIVTITGGNSGKAKSVTTGPTTTAGPTPVSLVKPPDGATITGDTPCPKADGSSPRTLHFSKPPPTNCTSPARTYVAEIRTSLGLITVNLEPKTAPITVNNFVVLARYHFYDGIPFHRIIPGFVIQAGDPLVSGLGGPGYRFDDELPKGAATYKVGAVAMANSGPNTNGSQFFIVSGDTGAQLQPQYSLFGQATLESIDVVKKIEAAGSPDQSGAPIAVVTIESVTIKES